MTAEECIDRIAKVLSRTITITNGSSTTIINPGTDMLDRLWDIANIIQEYYKRRETDNEGA